jgi:acyl-CoA synthetase (AMP-forming)/AMP-acid ligase II
VLTQLPNIVEHVALYLAAARLGFIVSPLSMLARQHDLAYAFELLRPRAVVTCARFKELDHAALAREVVRDAAVPVLAFGERSFDTRVARVSGSKGRAAGRIDPDDVYTICWTSGTEAAPKAVPRSQNQWLAIGHAHYEGAGIVKGERLLNPFPLVNMASLGGCFTSWLANGGTLVLHHPFDLRVFLAQIAQERIGYTVAPPAVLTMLLKDEALAGRADLSSLRAIGSGSAPLSEWMIRSYRDRYGIEVVNIFGSNEGVALVSGPADVPDPAHRARFFPRYGRADIPWAARISRMLETRVLDPSSGEEITEPGRPGELAVRGPTVFSGYIGPAELTKNAFTREGFYRTGDLFEIAGAAEEARFYRYIGRLRQVIVRGGAKISPEELDHLLAGHPELLEAAVVGYPDEILGERVCAVIVPKAGSAPTLDSICAYLQSQGTAVYKLPERVAFAERLPRNALGKVLRNELATLAQGAA